MKKLLFVLFLCIAVFVSACNGQGSISDTSETDEIGTTETTPTETEAQTTAMQETSADTTTEDLTQTTPEVITTTATTAVVTTAMTDTTPVITETTRVKKPIVKEPLEIEFSPQTGYDQELFLFGYDYTPWYKEYDRNLTLEDFLVFEPGATYGEIAEQVGNPNGMFPSSLNASLFYMLEDNSYIHLQMSFTFWPDLSEDTAADKTVYGLLHKQEDGTENLWEFSLPDGREASYIYRENTVATPAEKFSALKIGMNKNSVFSYVGTPNGYIKETDSFYPVPADEIIAPDYVYKMEDGSYIIVQLDNIKNGTGKSKIGVTEVYRLNADGSKTPIVPAVADT